IVDGRGLGGEVREERSEGKALAVSGEAGGGERPGVLVVGDDFAGAGSGRGECRHAATRPQIQHPSPFDPFGVVEDDPGERHPTGPRVGPEGWRHGTAGESFGRLPDLDQPTGAEYSNL